MEDIRVDKVGVRDIENILAKKKAEASEWTARKYYIHLASAFETAKKWNYIMSNPFRMVAKPKTKEIQPVYFGRKDVDSLLKEIDDLIFNNLCLLALYTGLRQGEILNLQWSDIDMVDRIIHVNNSSTFTTKGRKNRLIPISDQLYQILFDMKENASSELVFHSRGKILEAEKVSKIFKRCILKAELNEKLHFHSLRHTFASWLVQDGVSLYEVQKLLGHSNISVTQVYAHLQPERLHSTVNRISIVLN